MKLVIISDTHTQQPELPDGDVLIHCGDLTFRGESQESRMALNWLNLQPHKHKLVIAGNHELGWEREERRKYILSDFKNIIYLHNSGIKIKNIHFWGSPYQPHFCGWAFQRARGEALEWNWSLIPKNTDVLITHGPPFGYGDLVARGEQIGDVDLLNRVLEVKPRIHCFGHNHSGYGQWKEHGIHFINAALLNEEYKLIHLPVEVDL